MTSTTWFEQCQLSQAFVVFSANGSEHDHLQVDPEREQSPDPRIPASASSSLRLRADRRQVHSLQRSRTSLSERRHPSHRQSGRSILVNIFWNEFWFGVETCWNTEMHTVWKSMGRVHEVFTKLSGGGYIVLGNFLGGRVKYLIRVLWKFWRHGPNEQDLVLLCFKL